MNTDLTEIYKKYKGLWVALDDNLKNVLASGVDAKKTYEKAKKKCQFLLYLRYLKITCPI